MYLPKSQIRSNKYTNGNEFIRSDNGNPYSGPYWQDSSGRYFSGKTPQDTPTVEILLDITDTVEVQNPLEKITSWTTDFNSKITENKPGRVPQKYIAKPEEKDYTLGEFERYFTKKANQKIYFEISKKDYQDLKSQNNNILWQLYIPISLPWQLTGDKHEVATTNRNIVIQTEVNNKLPGFRKIFRKNYLEYYQD